MFVCVSTLQRGALLVRMKSVWGALMVLRRRSREEERNWPARARLQEDAKSVRQQGCVAQCKEGRVARALVEECTGFKCCRVQAQEVRKSPAACRFELACAAPCLCMAAISLTLAFASSPSHTPPSSSHTPYSSVRLPLNATSLTAHTLLTEQT